MSEQTIPAVERDAEIDAKLEEILAKSDDEVMFDAVRELFPGCADDDSPQFTRQQMFTSMHRSFDNGKEHIQMLERAKAEAANRLSLIPNEAKDE